MKYKHSLKNRIKIAFCGFGFILAMSYWLLIDISMNIVEDKVFENRLKNEISAYLDRHSQNPDAFLPVSAYIQSYLGTERMPGKLKEMITGLPEGFYETDGPNSISGPEDFHVAVKKMPDSDALLYLFFDVGTLKIHEKYETVVRTFLFFSSIVVALIGAGLGALIAKQVIAPVTELAEQVTLSEPDNLPVELSGRFAEDEVGFLARTLEQRMQRIQDFIKRETAFTRDASHELRTPVTVIKGALELIVQMPEYQNPALKRPLHRIERSVKRMATTIETFLWLAREDVSRQDEIKDQTCDVLTVVKEIFSDQTILFEDKPIQTELRETDAPVIHAPEAVFRIVMNNLVANAFHYTARGKVRLTVNKGGIDLFNSGTLELSHQTHSLLEPNVRGKNSQGFGFGLAIAKQLCLRYGWQLDIREYEGQGTLVSLGFNPDAEDKSF